MKDTLLITALLLAPLAARGAAEPDCRPQVAPRNAEELKVRMADLRRRYAPFLESRPATVSVRQRHDLCGDDWLSRFEIRRVSDEPSKEMAPRPVSPGWEKVALDVSAWEPTSVPEWRYDGLARRQPASCILWYRKTFAAKHVAKGQRMFLVFEGVDWEAEVWLNGKRLGSHSVYFEPFRFDVTDVVAETNTLAVRVIDGPQFGEPAAYWAAFPVPSAVGQRYVRDRARSLAGLQKGDTHNGSGYGIHREVYLETTAPAIVTDVRVRGYPGKRRSRGAGRNRRGRRQAVHAQGGTAAGEFRRRILQPQHVLRAVGAERTADGSGADARGSAVVAGGAVALPVPRESVGQPGPRHGRARRRVRPSHRRDGERAASPRRDCSRAHCCSTVSLCFCAARTSRG